MSVDLNISDLFRKVSIGLSVEMNQDGSSTFSAVEVQLQKNQLVLKRVFEIGKDIDDLVSQISPQTITFVLLNGKGILHKLSSNNFQSDKELVNSILPQADEDDFYSQQYLLPDGRPSISLVRKKTIDSLLNKFFEYKINVSAIILGNEILGNIHGLFEGKPTQLNALGQSLHFENGALIDIQTSKSDSNQTLELDDITLNPAQQLAFCSAIQHFSPDPNLKRIYHDKISSSALKHKKKKFVKTASLTFAAFSFCLLLINTLVFVNLNTKVSELQSALAVNQAYLIEAQNLTSDIEAKKMALTKVNANNKSISFYSDLIASILPYGLILNDLNVYPKEKQLKKDDFDSFDVSSIEINGLVSQNNQLHEFIRLLSDFDWIEKVTLSSLEKESKGNDSAFQLKLQLKP